MAFRVLIFWADRCIIAVALEGSLSMSKRKAISLKVKLAATLLAFDREYLRCRSAAVGHDLLSPISHAHAKQMSADQIISLYQFDHWPIRKVDGGPDEPWNLEPRLIREHRIKTAKIDVPAIAKDRRVDRKWREFMAAVAAKRKPPKRKSRWATRKIRRKRNA